MRRTDLYRRIAVITFLVVGVLAWVAPAPAQENSAETGKTAAGAAEDRPDAETVDAEGAEADGGVDYNRPPLLPEPPLFVCSLAMFLVLVFVGRRVVWQPLIENLNAREGRVNRAYAFVESSRAEIEDLVRQHEARIAEARDEVKSIVAAARQEAEQVKDEMIAQAGAEARELQERSIAEIHAAREEALGQLSQRIDEYTDLAAEHVMGRVLRN
jgi:F-type H+-transporting ATPase subunit b